MKAIEPLDFPRDDHVPVGDEIPDEQIMAYEEEAAQDDDSALLEEKVRTVARGDKALKFGIIASVVLHAFLVCAMPRVMNPGTSRVEEPQQRKEEVSKVRLVEFKTPPKEEPPPEHASAMSDRDHTAIQERIPKSPPIKEAAAPPETPHEDKRVASLQPTVIPKGVAKPEETKPSKTRKVDKKTETDKKDKTQGRESGKNSDQPSQEKQAKPEVDLRPTMEDFRKGILGDPGSADFFPEGDMEEAVLDINTRHERFFSYLLHLKQKIEAVWVYPKVASKVGLGGDLTVEFSLGKDGKLVGVSLLDSSGNQVLDDAAVNAIREAAPYHPFPPRLKTQRLRIRAKFIYVTSTYFRKVM